jgi:inorganic pyrophosphatase
MKSRSFILAEKFLGKTVEVAIDRPLGSKHPKFSFIYELNYGYIPDIIAPDGEELDAYIVGEKLPLEKFSGKCIAIVHRLNDDDDKLVVSSSDVADEEIKKAVEFQEKFFEYEIIRK